MADHVAVLRVLRDFYAGSVLNHAEKAAALDHAIATCEQHAALVARLGEADALLAEVSRSGWGRNTMFDIAKKTPLLERIDGYLARQQPASGEES